MVMSCGKVMCCALPSSSPASSLFFASFFTAPGFLLTPIFLFHLFPFFFVLPSPSPRLGAGYGLYGVFWWKRGRSIEGWIRCLFVGWRTATIRARLMVRINGVLCIYVWRVRPTADGDRSAFRLSADCSPHPRTVPESGDRQPQSERMEARSSAHNLAG